MIAGTRIKAVMPTEKRFRYERHSFMATGGQGYQWPKTTNFSARLYCRCEDRTGAYVADVKTVGYLSRKSRNSNLPFRGIVYDEVLYHHKM